MAAYLAQAADYQVADVKLGLLLVLDISKHAVPTPGIERCVWVSEVPVGTSGEVRHVVFFRIPGRKKRPSDQTALQINRGSKRMTPSSTQPPAAGRSACRSGSDPSTLSPRKP
jgi:hypothetical protein